MDCHNHAFQHPTVEEMPNKHDENQQSTREDNKCFVGSMQVCEISSILETSNFTSTNHAQEPGCSHLIFLHLNLDGVSQNITEHVVLFSKDVIRNGRKL